MLGDFLEISLVTPDILASLEFYRKLGFTEAPVRDAWSHPYAVVTDGRIYIGLHRRDAVSPTLSFVLPDLSRHLPVLESLGIKFAYRNIELHRFNEVGIMDSEGGMVGLVEARTFSPVHAAHVQPSLCGYFLEYRLPTRNVPAALGFWESLGLIVSPAEDGGPAQVSWGGINITLVQPGPRVRPALVFATSSLQEAAALVEMRGLPAQAQADGLSIATPEGINLMLRPEQ